MIRAFAVVSAFLCSAPVLAEAPPPTYQKIAAAYGVPSEVLFAVARQESNARLTIGYYPWPWTLNVDGEGKRFATLPEACAAAIKAIAEKGRYKVDIGIAQLNWGWNGARFFASPCDSLDPIRNLQVAASLLRGHYNDSGSWIEAIGRYHHPKGGAPAEKYKKLVAKHLERISIAR
ncbi:transglycosylase SLT domain-containing protein [Pseudomonas sp. JG-B]|uniref:transglycosylase SLT domain-containing protein n=1 Tax=Pseudomonas sp. JG-B TaxID=2603214 RepID=UPI00129D7B79|nr:transglycosylase SLT domain-containing protein [Pseudomonas sp. JG-B]MRK19077.1 lytic transglycosylase domain-containing protein [Pseudomonas sp. JG-B]